MKLVEATWEQRNLGITVYEAALEPQDTPGEVTAALTVIHGMADYVSVKVPTSLFALAGCLEDLGYSFREVLTTVEIDHIPALDRVMQRYADNLASCQASQIDKAKIFDEIMSGLFTTDRFSLDPAFSRTQSANRYCNWINDEISRGGELHAITFKGNLVGFFLVRHLEKNRYVSLLAGIFAGYQRMGMGYFINHLAYDYCFRSGAKSVSTTYSSNNLSASNIHFHLPVRLRSQSYVFTRHTAPKESQNVQHSPL